MTDFMKMYMHYVESEEVKRLSDDYTKNANRILGDAAIKIAGGVASDEQSLLLVIQGLQIETIAFTQSYSSSLLMAYHQWLVDSFALRRKDP